MILHIPQTIIAYIFSLYDRIFFSATKSRQKINERNIKIIRNDQSRHTKIKVRDIVKHLFGSRNATELIKNKAG